ncbi:hypothetical protein [Brasilonema bromeliae]|uniref:Uncharacterized protein n=1 Tax=Brasilonema bromeliae SPC951 TaxID=385972 RepID=A0ABX1P415_9CYAN|nr:hypothetical protein [Brasilonema bromeliae]NMG19094.1 hypothetical protein [Brasilonema bromeliae SPC951]
MAQNINRVGMVQKYTKILHDLAIFIISPWLERASVKSLQKRVDYLERRLCQDLPNTEQRLGSLIQQLQRQFNLLQDNTTNRLDKLLEYDLPQQVLDVLKEQTDLIIQNIKPIVEDLIREQEENKPLQENISEALIQVKHHKIEEFSEHLQEFTALPFGFAVAYGGRPSCSAVSLPLPEEQSAASLEAGLWLLAHRDKITQEVADELLGLQASQTEVFRQNLSRYLKLLGSCLENGIQPRLLYQGIITHEQPAVEIYVNGFKLIQNKYIKCWEDSAQVSTEAAQQLRVYFKYLIDYLLKALAFSP